MPSWAKDNPNLLWQAADNFERANGTSYREFEVALPRELTPDQRLELVNDFVKQEIGDRHATNSLFTALTRGLMVKNSHTRTSCFASELTTV